MNNVSKLHSHTMHHWASLIIKRSNSRQTPVRIHYVSKNGQVHKDLKTKKIDLKNIFFQGISKKLPGECCKEAACQVSLR